MKKVTAILTIFFFSSFSFAEESKIEVINKGTPAPYTGILIDSKTGAKIIAEKEFAKDRCQVEVDYEKEKTISKCELENSRQLADKTYELEKTKVLLETMEKENERLVKVVDEESEDYSSFWFTGGTLTGIFLSIAIFYASVQISR